MSGHQEMDGIRSCDIGLEIPKLSRSANFRSRYERRNRCPDSSRLMPSLAESSLGRTSFPVSCVDRLLCFSGAHLHASVPNTTEAMRLSFETRTVNRADAIARYGAPIVDGGAVHTAYSMFEHIESGQKLGEFKVNLIGDSALQQEYRAARSWNRLLRVPRGAHDLLPFRELTPFNRSCQYHVPSRNSP